MKFKPVTLGDLIQEKRTVWAYCLDCCRERDIDASEIDLPADCPVPDVGKRMTCTNCRSRRIQTKPQLHALPIHEMRKRRVQGWG